MEFGKFDKNLKLLENSEIILSLLGFPYYIPLIIHKIITLFNKEKDLYLYYKKDWKILGEEIDASLNFKKSASKKNGDK